MNADDLVLAEIDRKALEGFVGPMIESLQRGAAIRLFMIAGARRRLKQITGKEALAESEKELVRALMEECIGDAISGYLWSLDNQGDGSRNIRVYVDGVLVSGRDLLQSMLYGENGLLEKYGRTSGMNSRNFLDAQASTDC
jgi:hypothetical protein